MLEYWGLIVARAWYWAGDQYGGAPSPVVLVLAVSLPPAYKWWTLGKQATFQAVAGDIWVGVLFAILLFVLGIVWAAPKIHVEQKAEIARLTEAMRGRFEVRHNPNGPSCDGGEITDQMISLGVEVSNKGTGNESLRMAVLDVATIEPHIRRRDMLPLTVGMWDRLNPGEPPHHAELVRWYVHQGVFQIRDAQGQPGPSFPVGDYRLTVIVHGENVPASTFVFWLRKKAGDEAPLYGLFRVD